MIASVRLRVTAVAVVLTAAALAVGGWGLLRAVERTQLGRIAGATEQQVDDVVARLEAGAAPDALLAATAVKMAGIIQIIDEHGRVLSPGPDPAEEPILVIARDGKVASGSLPPAGGLVATASQGSARVMETLPGSPAQATELQLEYRTVAVGGRELTVVAASPLAEVNRSLDAVRSTLTVGLPLVVALVGGLAWFVTGRALRPVEAMRAEVEAISHSTLHRRVPAPARADEIGRLARTMNAMLDRLESAVERQRRFVADASHELRSPVAALRVQLEVAARTGDKDAMMAAVETALAEEARIEDLLTDLLLLASVDEGAAPPAGPVDLGAAAAAEAAVPRRVPVSASGHGVVRGSTGQLRRVVANLVDNAVRHASSAVHLQVDGGRLVVDDDGSGIPSEDRERVFERFTRLDEGRARDDGGAGLGLSLVRAVAVAHGGRAWAEASPSGGARIVVQLPETTP